MSFLGSFFGGKSKSKSESVYTPNVPQWYKDMIESNMSKAQDLANRSADEGVAGFTRDQQNSFDLIRSMVGQGNPLLDNALNSVSNSITQGSDYHKFMNPYTENVIDNSNRKLVQEADKQRQQIRSNAMNASAFGNSRFGLQESELDKNLNQQIGDNTYKGLSDAFTWANDMALKDKSTILNQAQTAANLVGAQQNYNLADANALNKAGTQQQQLNQAGLDFGQTQANWFQGLLNSMPSQIYGATTSNTTTTPTAGWGSQLLGAGLAAAGMMTGNPALMMAGSSAGGGFGGGIVGRNNTPAGDYNFTGTNAAQVPWYSKLGSYLGFADGGHVQNFADGGLLERLNKWADVQLDDYNKNGSLLGSLLNGSFKVPDSKNRLESIMHAPIKRVADVMREPYDLMKSLGQGAGGVADYLTKDYAVEEKEKQAAKDLANKQKEFQKQADNKDSNIASQQNKQAEPSTPMQEVMKTAVEPVIQQETAKQNEASSGGNDIISMLKDQIQKAQQQKNNPSNNKGVNMPLLMAGLGMMASNKPFAQAIGEGGMLGASEYSKERSAEQERQATSDKHLQDMLIELQKAKVDQDYKNRDIALKEKKADSSIDYMKKLSEVADAKLKVNKETDSKIKDLQKQRDAYNKQLVAEIIPGNKIKLQQQIGNVQSQIDELLKYGNSNLAENQGSGVNSNNSNSSNNQQIMFDDWGN